MQHTLLAFDLQHPVDPVLLEVDALYQRFARLTDRRQRRGGWYSLALVLIVAMLAKLAGADDLVAIAHTALLSRFRFVAHTSRVSHDWASADGI